ncbi:MAG: Putative inner membrane protein [uncultured Sulfurovum sp.]|uniref:Inner membrane protein n=1 Tax=uncultured Sulfurovum sp. TaxID=269237 RepID=A0A6S6TKC1_9BACT|nr:MAG: Putative inner membrane protein [uncultured Sulfurovum sp.]
MKNLLLHFLIFSILILGVMALVYLYGKKIWYPYYEKLCVPKECKPCPSYECNLTHVGPLQPKIIQKECPKLKVSPLEILTSQQKLNRHLADNNFVIYPKNLTLIGLKYERTLEVWTKNNGENIHLVNYPFTSFSGTLGPKIKEGDRQIPEGIYGIGYLNPNSKFHLSMNINYPNDFDKRMAKKEKRTNLGSAIMIHGKDVSVGCIPIGDEKIEELYFLAEKVGIKNIKVILAPVDFRKMDVKIKENNKYPWLKDLYADIKKELKPFISK